ncbi:MAG: Asp-tRNA(Asn)/Glu-tRNA(Gln) amidotransferase subunit GatB [bacterium]
MSPAPGWELVVGLEVHVQLATETKIFCGCRNRFGDPPNTNVCPVCLGLPGALPVMNDRAPDLALRVALALGCEVPDLSVFARKNYFYPDLPKGYQISQFDRPFALGGRVPIEVDGTASDVPLVRIHLEEDAGKSLHDETSRTADTRIDANRCGTPLIEIVSEPAIRRAVEAGAYLESLRRLVRWLGVSDGDMSQGSLRCDANVSVRRAGESTLGTKTEVKNLNSIKMVVQAIDVEARRQVAVLERGEAITQCTLLWDERTGNVRPMRTKEDAHDYRYFPEPDLPPLRMTAERRDRVRRDMPELPIARRERFREAFDLRSVDAAVLTESRDVADWYEDLATQTGDPKLAANWVLGEVLRLRNERGGSLAELGLAPATLAELLGFVREGKISQSVAKKVFQSVVDTGERASAIVAREGLVQISDPAALDRLVDDVLAAAPEQVEQFRAGNEKVAGFLVGQVMKASGGQANPKLARERLLTRLAELAG